ncbi:unnamed protein product [Mytilus coruscus]|uniref:Uncharacterized protein n=1 Tax=Mytilus coruscus TaxID=42192 RepID=A0A6J8AA90_MYTCO|nr:unnamed protein product [Mytilus coruscus]
MKNQVCKSDGNDNGDCSDADLNKGSDDAVNVVKSPKHTSDIHSVLPHKLNYICIGTMVSVIGIVLTVVLSVTTLVAISTDDNTYGFKLKKDISRISNHLESISTKMNSYSSTIDGPQQCEKINNSYLYYAFREENRRLKAELQKTKSRKEENRRLKAELQKTKSRKDSITCADNENKRNQQEGRKKPLQVSCSSVSSVYNIYGWVSANRSLSFGRSDHFNIIIKFLLLYPEIPDNGKILFEFGLTTLADDLLFNYPVIIVRGQKCEKEPGICLYVIDNALTELEGHVFQQMLDYIQGQLTLELHKSYFVLMSNQKNLYISNMLNFSSEVKLWPVFGFYNTHLINISQTIFSENKISFNRTTVDPHLFVSEDNNTISNFKLRSKRTSLSGWDIRILFIEIAFFTVSTILCFLFFCCYNFNDKFVQILDGIGHTIKLKDQYVHCKYRRKGDGVSPVNKVNNDFLKQKHIF